jgi:hypothetical protein
VTFRQSKIVPATARAPSPIGSALCAKSRPLARWAIAEFSGKNILD